MKTPLKASTSTHAYPERAVNLAFSLSLSRAVLKHHFKIVNADLHVLTVLEQAAEFYPKAVLDSLRAIHRK